jgi:uncharacterized protein (TIGR00730 family)
MALHRLCVFCGSSPGDDPAFREAARALGQAAAADNVGLVYGGASIGLMGAVADAALEAGGEVIGVIPHGLVAREVAHPGLTALHQVDSMHARKQRMAELADGFVALPGGLGTLEELFEVWTWALLGIHRKPVGLLEVGGYYADLLRFLDGATRRGFVRAEHRALLAVADQPAALIAQLRAYQPPPVRPWLSSDET